MRDLPECDLDELYLIREFLHRTAAVLTPLPLSVEVPAELKQIRSDRDAAFRESNPSTAFCQNEQFRLALNRACGNSVLERAVNFLKECANLVRSIAFRSIESLHRSANEHHGNRLCRVGPEQDNTGQIMIESKLGFAKR